MKKAIYAGTFDPFTLGHLDIVKRGLKIFDEVTVLVAVPPSKKPFMTKELRVELLNKIFKDEPRVLVDAWDGLIVEYAKNKNITSIIRGLRPTGDFESEFQMATMNRKLNQNTETVFLMTGENLYFISSSLVREVFRHGGIVKDFVPEPIFLELEVRRKGKDET